jgi:alpha-L-rhamnosidase
MGATTIWERWDSMLPDGSINPGEMTSFNHYALGSVVNWLHDSVGGIRPLEAGWKKFVVKPVPGGTIDEAETTYESPYGRIRCAWTIQDGKSFQLSISVPPNSSAVVILPEKNGPRNDQAKADDAGILCHSGEYTFACEYVAPGPWPPKPLMTGFREPEDEDIE